MQRHLGRRQFLQSMAATSAALTLGPHLLAADADKKAPFKISLAQWSLHRTIRSGKLDNLDFAKTAKEECGIEAIEYVNQFFKDKAKDEKYLAEMNKRAADNGVKQLLIMVDGEGALGDPNEAKRKQAVENHYKWAEAAKTLGGHSIRVNAQSGGSYEEQIKLAADGLSRLSEFAKGLGLNVIVENHGGLSSNGQWLASVMKTVDMDNCGTLPDFGNFRVSKDEMYDRYKGVDELMPYAKAVSAKSHQFNEEGLETNTDFFKMMDIVVNKHGYHGYVGVEWEGGNPGEIEGIILTRKLLEKCAQKLAS
ncbi:Xylose isomerase-like TIM barrel [Bremerella volcania]|uniref:Xylose isomerase-like TIM barrel n=1 Tax=Bremerella volcania TaxID=2527984 RepID=A0A518CBK0_9BACT|nr:sugar phosphate isomerase/epimerase family protein [Bremerella volcania]QDU76605.1 Xylose isomerase-like TIM barrel [Bremerella volcania]